MAHQHGRIRMGGPNDTGLQQDVCNHLLHHDPSQRLAHNDDVSRLFAHNFFESLDPRAIEEGKFASPLLGCSARQACQHDPRSTSSNLAFDVSTLVGMHYGSKWWYLRLAIAVHRFQDCWRSRPHPKDKQLVTSRQP